MESFFLSPSLFLSLHLHVLHDPHTECEKNHVVYRLSAVSMSPVLIGRPVVWNVVICYLLPRQSNDGNDDDSSGNGGGGP